MYSSVFTFWKAILEEFGIISSWRHKGPEKCCAWKKTPKHTQTTVFKVGTEIQNLKKSTAILDPNDHPTSNHWPQVLSNSA